MTNEHAPMTKGGVWSEVEATTMHDDKRFLRKLKRDVKQAGNRKRRRYLKDVNTEPDDFDFGRSRSDVMNEPRQKNRQARGE